jgi:hypothetical protein
MEQRMPIIVLSVDIRNPHLLLLESDTSQVPDVLADKRHKVGSCLYRLPGSRRLQLLGSYTQWQHGGRSNTRPTTGVSPSLPRTHSAPHSIWRPLERIA